MIFPYKINFHGATSISDVIFVENMPLLLIHDVCEELLNYPASDLGVVWALCSRENTWWVIQKWKQIQKYKNESKYTYKRKYKNTQIKGNAKLQKWKIHKFTNWPNKFSAAQIPLPVDWWHFRILSMQTEMKRNEQKLKFQSSKSSNGQRRGTYFLTS